MDTRKFTITVDGIKEAIANVKSLKEAIDSIDASVGVAVEAIEESSKAKKTSTKATDELGKVQSKLNDYDKAYATEVAKAKAALGQKNTEVKNAVKMEQDLQIIEVGSMNTYREKQTYLSALNRVIRNMTDEEQLNGKSKQDLIQISAEVQQSLKDEDEAMKIYTRNVGNYSSALEGVEVKLAPLESEMGELKDQMARMLVDGVSPTSEAFQELAKRAGAIKDACEDAEKEISHFASDTAAMDDVVNVAQTATASYALLLSATETLGIENEEVTEGIRKLEAAQTALNSLNTLSASLLDNSTASYKIYHAILQAVGLEKKATAAATATLTAAEGAEAVGATTAATATAAFAASLWAVLSPLLVIVAIIAVVAAGIYGLVAAFDALFGPTEEETAAMEAQCETMNKLNDLTKENIELLKAKGATEAQVLNDSINMYRNNLTKLEEHVKACEEFYGEDSDEYKEAVEKKKEAEEELQKLQNDGLVYLTKKISEHRKKRDELALGEYEYKKKVAKDEYNYQIKLLDNLLKAQKISVEERKKMLADLKESYNDTIAEIDKENAEDKKKNTRGLGNSTSADDAAKNYKKAAEELSKAVDSMQTKTTDMIIDRRKKALEESKALAKEIEVVDDETYEEKWKHLEADLTKELNERHQQTVKEIKEEDDKFKEIQKKYKGHTDLLLQYEQEYKRQKAIIEQNEKDDFEKIEKDTQKLQDEALNERNNSQLKALQNSAAYSASYADAALKNVFHPIDKSLKEIQKEYKELIPNSESAAKAWKQFWDLEPDTDKYFEFFETAEDGQKDFTKFIEQESKKASDALSSITSGGGSNLQKSIADYYDKAMKGMLTLKRNMITEGKSEDEINEAMINSYSHITQVMSDYKQQLIDLGKTVGDVTTTMNAMGEVVDKVPTDGLNKSEEAAKKWSSNITKFLGKAIDPFKDTLNALSDSVNGVFSAINDWLQSDIDKLADAIDEITEKYDELTDAVSTTEETITSLKEEFKEASTSDKNALAQKIAEEEALLAQEKAAQQEAYNEQVGLDEKKQELENEQQKRNLTLQQFNAGISLINSLISTAEGMAKEYSKGVLGIPTATLIGVLGGIQSAAIGVQIAALQAQKSRFAEGGYVDSDGMLHGNSHAQGGIDIRVGKSRIIEAEGGEFIINKKSSERYYDILAAINNDGKSGKTISALGRRKYADGGSLNFDMLEGSIGRSTERQMQRVMENVTINPKVSVVDIIRKTDDYNRVRVYAGR